MAADIPVTYVPARNTIFLSYALALAEVLGSTDLFLGVNAVDYSGYPDCRPEFIASFERTANLATKAGVEAAGADPHLRVHAPLISLTKVQIIELGPGARCGLRAHPLVLRPGGRRGGLRALRFVPVAREGVRRPGAKRPRRPFVGWVEGFADPPRVPHGLRRARGRRWVRRALYDFA